MHYSGAFTERLNHRFRAAASDCFDRDGTAGIGLLACRRPIAQILQGDADTRLGTNDMVAVA